jgi:deazaflavin-dependent oxidoreductase (nitroreductase family)
MEIWRKRKVDVSDQKSSKEEAAIATNAWNATIIEEFHANQGTLGGTFEGAPVLLLHTRGARTNEERVNPMMYLEEDGGVFVFASKAGADTNPDWFHNLVANAHVKVEMGTETFEATAKPLHGEERDHIYAIQSDRFPRFAEYQEKTIRTIPVVELVRS